MTSKESCACFKFGCGQLPRLNPISLGPFVVFKVIKNVYFNDYWDQNQKEKKLKVEGIIN